MKRKLAIIAAKWLGKRENREKVKRTASRFRSRMEQEKGPHETHPGDTSREHESSRGRTEHHEDSPRSSGRT